MNFETIRIETDQNGTATLTLNQPDKHNALSANLISELSDAAKLLADADDVRVVVLTGEGKSFCAGGDLGWMRQQFEANRDTRIGEAMKLARMLRDLNELPKPLIGRINGQAFGGGIGMISVCDLAVGVADSKFALTETRLGLIPATISPYVVSRMGQANARRVFMSGRRFDGAEAVELGLLAKAVPAEELDTAIAAEVEAYSPTAPGAVVRSKALVFSVSSTIDENMMLSTATQLADCWDSEEGQEGIRAFFDKRRPSWQS